MASLSFLCNQQLEKSSQLLHSIYLILDSKNGDINGFLRKTHPNLI